MNEHNRPKLLRNIRIAFGLSLLLLIVSSVASYSSIRNLLNSSQWVDHTDSVINDLANFSSLLKDAETGQRGFMLTGDTAFLHPFNIGEANALIYVDRIEFLTRDNPVQQVNVRSLRSMTLSFFPLLKDLIDQKRTNNLYSPDDLRTGKAAMDSIRQIIQRMQQEEHQLLAIRTEKLKKFSTYTPVLILLAALLSIIITLFFYQRVSRDYRERALLYEELRQKDDETVRRIRIIGEIADKISDGNYGTRVSDKEKDELGSLSGSLNKMAQSLEYSFGLLSDKEWLQTGIAQLNEVMVGDNDMPTLARGIIDRITLYTGSVVGALYVLDSSGAMLELKGGHALSASDRRLRIKKGEGLVGQVAADGRQVLLTGIGAGEWTLSLATGDIRPTSIIAFPFFFDKNIKGVIELGSVGKWSGRDLEYISNIGENIGAAINRIEIRAQLQELLEETQAQSEELQTQHSELENLNMELEMQAEKLQASEEELKVQQAELQQSNQELEEKSRSLEEKNELVLLRNLDIQKKAEELALNARYKSEFMANMSHELRTPLNSILLLSKLLSENKPGNLSAEQTEYARVIQNSGQGLLELIDEILDLSRIESGKLKPEIDAVSVAEVVEDMRMLFAPLAGDKGLDFVIGIDNDTPPELQTDKGMLEQILKNLLSNAFKFTPRGRVALSIAAPGHVDMPVIDFSVRDTGIGIPEDKHMLIFDAFQQADGSTRRKYGGTGLGLSISRELAKLLGGYIRLVSSPGEGSEFIVSIPLSGSLENIAEEGPGILNPDKAMRSDVAVRKNGMPRDLSEKFVTSNDQAALEFDHKLFRLNDIPASIPDDREHIISGDKVLLIVEDDTTFAGALLEFSRRKGYKGIVAVSGDAGIGLAKTHKPLGILLDIQLPVKSGWEVMEELKNDPLTRHIPVHIISSYEVKQEGMRRGAIDFIHKPVPFEKMDSIFSKIESALSKGPRKVIIIEDNTKHAEALAWFLNSYEVRMEIASSIAGCVAALENQDVDTVILDMGAGGLNVNDALDEMKKYPALTDVPIIIFTGKTIARSEELRLKEDSMVVKTAHSYQRVLDEVSLFLHLVGGNDLARKNMGSRLGTLDEVLKNKTVLVADDDVRNIYSLTKVLENHRMQVYSAMDGREAISMMEGNSYPIDIVLMDMMMPEMDGYEAIARIRNNPAYKDLPIIAVTAKAMAGDRDKCIQAGASDYISKPVDIDQLLSLLRIWLYEK